MNFRKNLYTLSIRATISTALLALAGCGLTPQDEGLGSSSSKPVSGVVVDGYLAGATVYVDVNENNKLDAWEKRALTDTKGYYSYNPITEVNYCELPESDSKYIHCLNSPAGFDEVMVRMTGGYDLATVEPFTGTISMRMNLTSAVITTPLAATPITGLMSEMTDEEQVQFLSDEGITANVATSDFLDYNNSLIASDRRKLLNLALKAHKVADVVAVMLDGDFDQGLLTTGGTAKGGFFGVEEKIPVDGSLYVYQAMIEEAITTSSTLSDILSDVTKLEAVIELAKTKITDGAIKNYNDRLNHDVDTGEIDESETPLVAPTTVDAAAYALLVFKITDTIDSVFGSAVVLDETSVNTLSQDIISRIRAVDAVVSLTRNGEASAAVDNAVLLAKTDAAYLINLREPAVDMASLKKKFIANPGSIVAGDADFSGRKAFSQLFASTDDSAFSSTDPDQEVNTEGFSGNTLDLNNTPDGQTDADEVKVEFLGDSADADGGDLKIDATLLGGDFAKKDEETGEPVPLELDGTWEKIDDYTMLMNIEVTEGVFEPVIVKPNEAGGYYFDLGGDQVVWGDGTAEP